MIEIEGLTKRFTRNVGNPSIWRRFLGRYETEPVVAGMVVVVGIAALLLFRRMMVRLERTGALALF